MVTVYGLVNKGKVFYIGQTTNISDRMYVHKSSAIYQRTNKERYIYNMLSNGKELNYIILAKIEVNKANETERNFIISYLDNGYKLMNRRPNKKAKYLPKVRKINNEVFNYKDKYYLQLIANDNDTNDISIITGQSKRTIEGIRNRLRNKAKVKSIAALMYFAYRNRLIK